VMPAARPAPLKICAATRTRMVRRWIEAKSGAVSSADSGCVNVCLSRRWSVIRQAARAQVSRPRCLKGLLNSSQAAPMSMGRPASFHSRMPSAARRAVTPWPLNRRTASWASTQ
jgi:hypothetical protein